MKNLGFYINAFISSLFICVRYDWPTGMGVWFGLLAILALHDR